MNKLLLSYLAGFLDDEGTICASRNKGNRYHIRVAVYNTNLSILNLFKNTFKSGVVRVRDHKRFGRKESFMWYIRRPEVEKVLTLLKPYIRLKKKQLELALKFIHLSKFVMVKRKRIIGLKIKKLNK